MCMLSCLLIALTLGRHSELCDFQYAKKQMSAVKFIVLFGFFMVSMTGLIHYLWVFVYIQVDLWKTHAVPSD